MPPKRKVTLVIFGAGHREHRVVLAENLLLIRLTTEYTEYTEKRGLRNM